MKYLCLIYDEEKKMAAMSKTEGDAFMGEYFAFTEGIKKRAITLAARHSSRSRLRRAYGSATARCRRPTARSPRRRSNSAGFT